LTTPLPPRGGGGGDLAPLDDARAADAPSAGVVVSWLAMKPNPL
jgi:hypothetical protein